MTVLYQIAGVIPPSSGEDRTEKRFHNPHLGDNTFQALRLYVLLVCFLHHYLVPLNDFYILVLRQSMKKRIGCTMRGKID